MQTLGASSPLLESRVNQLHWFVVENEGDRVSVRVKGTQNFWQNLIDRIREIFLKKSLQSQVMETAEKTQK